MTKLFMSALLALSLLFSSFSFAGDWWERNKEWAVGQGIFLTLLAIDWRQTQVIATDPKYIEVNPILGNNPSISKVNRYFFTVGLLHTAGSWFMWKWNKDVWRWFIGFSIGTEANMTWYNLKVGIRF